MIDSDTDAISPMGISHAIICSSAAFVFNIVTHTKQLIGMRPSPMYWRNAVLALLLMYLIVVMIRQIIVDSPATVIRNIGEVKNVFVPSIRYAMEASTDIVHSAKYSARFLNKLVIRLLPLFAISLPATETDCLFL